MTTTLAPHLAAAMPPPAPMPIWAAGEAQAINQRFAELRIAARCVRARSFDAFGTRTEQRTRYPPVLDAKKGRGALLRGLFAV